VRLKFYFIITVLQQLKLEKGDKIAQLVPQPVVNFEVEEVEELFETKRGKNGFGSTGK